MRALRSEPSTADSDAVSPSNSFQRHDTPMPKSVVRSRRSFRRMKGQEKNVYASIGRVAPLPNDASEKPNPQDGMPYRWCHSWLPSVWRPTSTVRLGPQLIGLELEVKGLSEKIRAVVTPVRRNRSEERRVGKECRSRWAPEH